MVTGITPTRAGEGKTTVTVGLTQGLGKLGEKVIANLREPSLGPIFGIKGGGTGGGKTTVMPDDEINIHFTGDAHAVGSAHNLLAALTDNAVQRSQIQGFGAEDITWRRVTDVEDRALRSIMTGIGGEANAPVRETGFDIVTASEVMAILALASGLGDLRARISRIVVGFTRAGNPVTADDVGAVGSMMSLLRYAIQPNLVQTAEGQPVIVHAGPFGNIAHGCSSVIADKMALALADYVVTEAGFGADLGFEKFMHIKARFNDVEPHAAVIVASVKALKSHAGIPLAQLNDRQSQGCCRWDAEPAPPHWGDTQLQPAGSSGNQPISTRHRRGDRLRSKERWRGWKASEPPRAVVSYRGRGWLYRAGPRRHGCERGGQARDFVPVPRRSLHRG